MTSLFCHAVAAFLLFGGVAEDAEDPQQTPVSREDPAVRAQRLAFLTERASEYQIFVEGEPLKMTAQPVFRWSHPIAKLDDAAVFLWMDGGEPIALGTMILHNELGLFSEFQSVTSSRLETVKQDATVWKPAEGCKFSLLREGPKPAGTAAERLAQMKAISRRFTVELTKGQPVYSENSTWQLRLLPKELVRFADSKEKGSDGAMFVFCHDTDPEVVLLLRTGDSAWEYALAPLTGWAAEAKCDKKVVWSQPRLDPVDDPKLPYIKFGPEAVPPKFQSPDPAKK